MDDFNDLKDIAYDMYQALDRLLTESRTVASDLTRPAEEAMRAYEAWEQRREQERQASRRTRE